MALTPEQCESRVILKVLAGSHIHGLNVETSDRDEEAIVVEPLSEAWGLGKPWEDTVQESPERDVKYFSLRKWCRMAANGNPNFLLMLFAPTSHILKFNALGQQLREMKEMFISKQAIKSHLGYMQGQRTRMVNHQREFGSGGGHGLPRFELIEKYGYDCYWDDTEFLTERGWLLYDSITETDSLGTINPITRCLEMQHFTARVSKPYVGDVLGFYQRYTQALVTPNHRMWHARARQPFHFSSASSVSKMRDWHFQVGFGEQLRDLDVSNTKLLVVGAYTSEGCVGKRLGSGSPSVLSFSQAVDGDLNGIMEQINATIPVIRHGPYSRLGRKDYYIYTIADRILAAQIVQGCGEGSHSKRLPPWFMHLSTKQARVLLNALLAGDGTVAKAGYRVYYTTSFQLAGDVQVLALIAGFRSNVWGPYDRGMYQVLIQAGAPTQRLASASNVSHDAMEGRIVCFTVPNEILVTRRCGKISMQGNTKFAMHLLRLGMQGEELAAHGQITLPMPESEREALLAVRRGAVSLDTVLKQADGLEQAMKMGFDSSSLPEQPNLAAIEEWMQRVYVRMWSADRKLQDIIEDQTLFGAGPVGRVQ